MRYFIWTIIIVFYGCSPKETTPPPPFSNSEIINQPILFDADISTTNGINFSKDGRTLYTSDLINGNFTNGRQLSGIFKLEYDGNNWSKPHRILIEPDIDAYHPVLSHDNQFLFFNSRSHPDSPLVARPHDIWIAENIGGAWNRPVPIEGINSIHYDSYPSIAKNGNLYFNSDRPGGQGGMDIYFAKKSHDRYETPVNLEVLNSLHEENDLTIDPDERFIIFNRYFHESRELDLYISYKQSIGWGEPRELKEINSSEKWELTPTISPDGHYLFYELDRKIMQVSLSAILTDMPER